MLCGVWCGVVCVVCVVFVMCVVCVVFVVCIVCGGGGFFARGTKNKGAAGDRSCSGQNSNNRTRGN